MIAHRRNGIAWIAASALLVAFPCAAETYAERSGAERAALTAAAAVTNVVPITSAFVAPRCLPGYFWCKLSFASLSVVGAVEQLLLSGGSDPAQTQAILSRGFGGDWIVTGRNIAGDAQVEPLPEPAAPPPNRGEGGFEPPPL